MRSCIFFSSICFVQFRSLELWKTLFRTFLSGWNSPLCSTGHTLGGEALKPSAPERQPGRKPIFLQAALTCRVPQYSSINTAGQVSVDPFPFLPSSATVTSACFVCWSKQLAWKSLHIESSLSCFYWLSTLKYSWVKAGEIAQLLRALAALAEDSCLVPCTLVIAQKGLWFQF